MMNKINSKGNAMSSLTRTKNAWKKIYSKYAAYINPVLKFLLALIVFITINAKMGYCTKINSFAIVLIVALFCSFMPLTVMTLIAGGFILLHYYSLSLECALVAAVLLLLMFMLYLRFSPKESLVVLLMPIFFTLKIPYLIPVAVGLLCTPMAAVAVAFGVVLSYLIDFTSSNEEMIKAMSEETMIARLRMVIDGMIANKGMMGVIVVFAIVVAVVYTIRRLSVDHSWKYATVAGAVLNMIAMLIVTLGLDLDVSVPGIIIGSILCIPMGILIDLFELNLDYKGAETLQFEDDDYYYYVKAVPKIDGGSEKKKKPAKKASVDDDAWEKKSNSSAAPKTKTVKTANGVKRTTK